MTRPITLLAALLTAAIAQAEAYPETNWEDLIPPGALYGEIIGDGDLDLEADTWRPVFDDNAYKLNPALDGAKVKIPGYIIPLELNEAGVTTFILAPYVGACIHVPPPPPNQLVLVQTETPWPNDLLWDAVWVSGEMTAQMEETELAEIGYRLDAALIEVYVWPD